MARLNPIKVLSVKIDCLTFGQVFQRLTELVKGSRADIVTTPNPEIILQAQSDQVLMSVINRSSLNIPDGTGLVWAAKYNSIPLTNLPVLRHLQACWQIIYSLILHLFIPEYGHDIIPERITGVDIVPEIAKICADNSASVFFLGAGQNVAKDAALRLQAINPKLIIAGTHSGHWPEKYDDENLKIINQTKPDVVVLAFGAPREQWWMDRNMDKIPSLKLIIGVGGSLDFIAGSASVLGGKAAKRAPKWIRTIKLEWLHRLIYQPDRWIRIFNAVFVFPFKIMIHKINQ